MHSCACTQCESRLAHLTKEGRVVHDQAKIAADGRQVANMSSMYMHKVVRSACCLQVTDGGLCMQHTSIIPCGFTRLAAQFLLKPYSSHLCRVFTRYCPLQSLFTHNMIHKYINPTMQVIIASDTGHTTLVKRMGS